MQHVDVRASSAEMTPAPTVGTSSSPVPTARARFRYLVLFALLAPCWPQAGASPGEVYVPAHRTRDGHYVPPNVPPLSAGTRPVHQPSRGTSAHRHARVKHPPPVVQARSDAR